MSLLGALKGQDTGNIEDEVDRVGGGNGPLDSALYDCTVKMAYAGKSKGGALSLTVWLETAEGRQIRETFWMTSGDAKGNKKFYETQQGEKKYLPGYTMANALCLLAAGKEIEALEPEMKIVGIYDFTARKEVNTNVEVLVDLIGKPIICGLLKQTVNKQVKNDAGVYVDSPDGATREQNEIDKFFRSRDKLTTAEIRAQQVEPAFYNTWGTKYTGVVMNKANAVSGGNAAAPGAAPATPKPQTSLFAA